MEKRLEGNLITMKTYMPPFVPQIQEFIDTYNPASITVNFNKLDTYIRNYLKKEYTEEVNMLYPKRIDNNTFITQTIDGLDAWIGETTKPSYMFCYSGMVPSDPYEITELGQANKKCQALLQVYLKCVEKRKAIDDEKEKIRLEEEEKKRKKEEYRINNRDKLIRYWKDYLSSYAIDILFDKEKNQYTLVLEDEKYHLKRVYTECGEELGNVVVEETNKRFNHEKDLWINDLKESITMHWFPERIDKGVRRPGEWKPDFNLDLLKKMYSKLYPRIAKKLEEEAWSLSKEKRDSVVALHKSSANEQSIENPYQSRRLPQQRQ